MTGQACNKRVIFAAMKEKRAIELLSPARDLECGFAAVNAGADAVYIGGPAFGAREDAGNSAEDIEKLIRYAHLFNAKVYITLNTILFDHELEAAERLAVRMYEAGADALIIQDMAYLEMNLPPIALHASTQTNNYHQGKVKLLERAGFSRVVLARELTLDQIMEIRSETTAELEFFVHGSLCVSLSGQCYLSYAIGGRSANRGACAQPCRRKYSITDKDGKIIEADKHLLSLKDLNLSEYIKELADAGIDSLKIEGRLKDAAYVKNITSFYRQKIDRVIATDKSYFRPSAGKIYCGFTPDPAKSFSRGSTDYFLHGRNPEITSFDTPKSLGEAIGRVKNMSHEWFEVDSAKTISNNDGLAFIDRKGETVGIKVNRSDGNRIFPNSMRGLFPGAFLYRNYDHGFNMLINSEVTVRKMAVTLEMDTNDEGVVLKAVSETGATVSVAFPSELQSSRDTGKSLLSIRSQLSKSGGTPFEIESVNTNGSERYFFTASFLNNIRRKALDDLRLKLESKRPEDKRRGAADLNLRDTVEGFESNISNYLSKVFYEKAGAQVMEMSPEFTGETGGKRVMTTRHCLRYSYGLCRKSAENEVRSAPGPMYLVDGELKLRLEFDCKNCFMNIFFEEKNK